MHPTNKSNGTTSSNNNDNNNNNDDVVMMMMYFNLCLVKLSYKNYTTHMFIMTQISPSKQKHKNKFSLNM